MANYKKVGIDLGIGLAAGAADQMLQIQDDKRASDYAAANPGKKLSFWKQYGTWLNFAAPLLGVGLVAMGKVNSDENVARIALVGGQLAGRKLIHRFVKGTPESPAPYAQYHRAAAAREAAAREAAAREAAGRTYDEAFNAAGAKAY
jgi:hypothetical protein